MKMPHILQILAATSLLACRPEAAHDLSQIPLESPATSHESADPSLARDPSTGDMLLSWVGGDSTDWALYVARSRDEGKTWSTPTVVTFQEETVRPQGESSPRLVAAPHGKVAVAWVRTVEVPGRKWPATEVRLAHSRDGGITWSAAVTLNDDTGSGPAGHQFHGAAWSGDSGLVVSWLDERGGASQEIHHGAPSPTAADPTDEPDAVIYTARSADFGRTWTPSNHLMWGQVCPCCRISLARGPDGRVISAWRKHYPGNIRDVVTAPVDEGTPAEPGRVHLDEWVYPGCPYTGPGISVDSAGTRHIVWYIGKEGEAGVYYQKVLAEHQATTAPVPLLQARTLPSAHTSVAALGTGGALAAYDMTVAGERAIGVSLIGASRTVREALIIAGSEGGQYPQVLYLGADRAVVAWVGKQGNRREIRLTAIRFRPESTGSNMASKE